MQTQGGFLITQIKQLQDRIFERLLAERGIDTFNGAQGRILYVLWQQDDLPIRELSRRTALAKTTLTSMLDRMEQQGHIRRRPDPVDRRQTRITLTDSARLLDNAYDKVSKEMTDIFYEGFSEEAVNAFEKQLSRVLANLKRQEPV